MTNWHIITCEYPPQIGGVSDYTRLLARELRKAGDDVQVWAPQFNAAEEPNLHRELSDFSSAHLKTAGELLDRYPKPRTLLVQWVPHGYGKRGINVGFTRWIASRVHQGDRLYLMVHEPFLDSDQRQWKHRIVALMQRRMIRTLLHSAERAFISIPAWENCLVPYIRPPLHCEWLPIPATIENTSTLAAISTVRSRFPAAALIIGHLGTYSAELRRILEPALARTLELVSNTHALLLGSNSDRFAAELQAHAPALANRIHGTGLLTDADLSNHIAACDVALQPYIDGLSSRRTSLMNVISHGVPVVSNFGHLTESLWGGSNAVALASTSEATQLAALCTQLLNDPQRRRELATAGRELYTSGFDWPAIISTLRSSREPTRTAAASTSSNPSGR